MDYDAAMLEAGNSNVEMAKATKRFTDRIINNEPTMTEKEAEFAVGMMREIFPEL